MKLIQSIFEILREEEAQRQFAKSQLLSDQYKIEFTISRSGRSAAKRTRFAANRPWLPPAKNHAVVMRAAVLGMVGKGWRPPRFTSTGHLGV